jgi:hypothetical protein
VAATIKDGLLAEEAAPLWNTGLWSIVAVNVDVHRETPDAEPVVTTYYAMAKIPAFAIPPEPEPVLMEGGQMETDPDAVEVIDVSDGDEGGAPDPDAEPSSTDEDAPTGDE